MKKYIIGLFLLSFIFVPLSSFAQTEDTDPNPTNSDCVALVNNLRYRDRDSNTNGEVSTLQDFLQSQGYLKSEPTGFNGLLTVKAVKDFQKANNISPASGYVASVTRAKIRSLTCGDVTPVSSCEINSFTVNGQSSVTVSNSEGALLEWKTNKCSSVQISELSKDGGFPVSGSTQLYHPQTKDYTLSAYDLSGSFASKKSVHITVSGTATSTSPQIVSTLGNQSNYSSNSSIEFTVKTSDGLGNAASTTKGYAVQAYVFPASDPTFQGNYITPNPVNSYNGAYDANTGLWKVKMNAPIDSGSYNLRVVLYCSNPTICNKLTQDTEVLPFTVGSGVSSSNLVIGGVSGPQTLNVNQTGTWTVSAFNRGGGNLSYSVVWGDETGVAYQGGTSNIKKLPVYQQSATFTHSYSQSGTYAPRFTVVNTGGQSASTSLSVNVGNVVTSPLITVLSPNGGETWVKGEGKTVNWKDNETFACKVGEICTPAPRYYEVNLVPYSAPCTNRVCPMKAIHEPYKILERVSGTAINWDVGVYLNSTTRVPDGSYTMQVCRIGTDICDSSDNPFTISAVATNTPSITILSPNGGETYTAGQQIVVRWSTANVNTLTTDNRVMIVLRSSISGIGKEYEPVPNTGSATITLPTTFGSGTPLVSGNYYKITTQLGGSSMGGRIAPSDSSDSTFTINNSTTVTPSITVLSPNGGDIYTAGQQITVNWRSQNIVGNISEINLVAVNGWSGGVGVTFDKEIPNNGTYTLTLPTVSDFSANNVLFGKYFKIELVAASGVANNTISDSSDNTFTINSSNTVTACAPGTSPGSMSLSPSQTSPISLNVSAGTNNVELAKINFTNTSNQNVCLNGIHLGSSSNLNNFITNTKIFDVATGLQVGTANGFVNNGSYYYSWVHPTTSLSLPAGVTKTFKVVSDIPSTATLGTFNAGIWGLNFDSPGAHSFPQVVDGNSVTIN